MISIQQAAEILCAAKLVSLEKAKRLVKASGATYFTNDQFGYFVAAQLDVDFKDSILENHYSELEHLKEMQAAGRHNGLASHWVSDEVAAGRAEIPIDEVIAHWSDRIAQMEAGSDQELFNY